MLKATLNSVGGEKASLILPAPDPTSCARCSVTLPVLQVTSIDFITKISDRNIKFFLPPELSSNVIDLVDPGTPTQIIRTFRTPFKGVPLGVLYDDNGVYLGFLDSAFSNLSLLVFEDGTFQFATRKEAESNGKSTTYTAVKSDTRSSYLMFQNRDKKQLLRYSSSCE